MQSSRFQTIASIPESRFESHIVEVKAQDEELTSAGMLRLAKTTQPDVIRINALSNNEWFTPKVYIDAVYQVLGRIDVDPASNPQANETVKAKTFYTQDDNGLEHDWPGKVWLNPPYGGEAADFIARLLQQFEAGITTEAITVVNSNVTDTKWFAPLWDHTLCFTNHRINFSSPTEAANGSTHGSVFVYLGWRVQRFVESFWQFGVVVRRIDK